MMWKTYEEWEAQVPEEVTAEGVWGFYGYRKGLFFYDLCWRDCERLLKHPLGRPVAQQLIRSAGSISANIEEGTVGGMARSAFVSWASRSDQPARAKAGTTGPETSWSRAP